MRAAPGVPAATPRCPFSGDTPASGLLRLLAEKACPPFPVSNLCGWGGAGGGPHGAREARVPFLSSCPRR